MDLAEVAVVNSPELTKGEETGFEFVHKSFAEYLAAEKMAIAIEESTYMIDDLMSGVQTWRMSEQGATTELATVFCVRLLTDEVQEMLVPMLGAIKPFLDGQSVSDRGDTQKRAEGLSRIMSRFESLLRDALLGKLVDSISKVMQEKTKASNTLEAYANFCAGLVLVGSAAAIARTALIVDHKV